MSPACYAHFENELCFYECDVHAGKYRLHDDCSGDSDDQNGWQIHGMPIKASECDRFYEDCKNDKICLTPPSKSMWSTQDCDHSTHCVTFGDTYADGKEMCESVWGTAFVYEENETNAYTWTFADGEANPNNAVNVALPFPEKCPFHEPDLSECGVEQATAIQGAHINVVQNEIDALQTTVEQTVSNLNGGCDVCHVQYWHKDVANATAFEAGGTCAQYRDNSCCTVQTAEKCALPRGVTAHPLTHARIYGDAYFFDVSHTHSRSHLV
jgi:hypothetical protein